MKITYDQIREAMNGEPYTMSLVSQEEDAGPVAEAVNQGIDSHLEACFVPDRGDVFEHGTREIGGVIHTVTMECVVSVESLPVLLRRLTESDDENAWMLASDILGTLEIHVDTGCFEIVSENEVES